MSGKIGKSQGILRWMISGNPTCLITEEIRIIGVERSDKF